MGSGLEVSVDLSGLEAMFSDAAIESAQDAMSRRWRDLVEPHVPMEYGPLREHVEIDGKEITYTEDYADYVYNMDDGTSWTTGGTSGHWDEAAKAEHLGDLEKYVASVLMGEAE